MAQPLYGSTVHIQTSVNCSINASRRTFSGSKNCCNYFLSSYRMYSGLAPSWVPYGAGIERAKLRVSCLAARRHHRRRDTGFGAPQIKPRDDGHVDRVSYSRNNKGSDDKVVITLDMEDWKQRAADVVVVTKRAAQRSVEKVVRVSKDFADESIEAWRELRSSVRVQKDRRVVIAVKRSTIDFAGKVLLWSILGTLFVKLLIYAVREYRWGWEEFSGPRRAVRDRSLGGREVILGSGFKPREGGSGKRQLSSTRGGFNPLDGVESSRSEKVLRGKRERDVAAGAGSKAARLPGWWPGASMIRSASIITRQKAEEQAHSLVQGIMQKRLIGYDFAFGDMIELRQLCKTAGTKVKFDTPNTRDTFYRAAINHVLMACCRKKDRNMDPRMFVPSGRNILANDCGNILLYYAGLAGEGHARVGLISGDVSMADFGTEDGVSFIAGLASNIGLEDDRAATMVNAAVAARTRTGFLQVRALQLQGKFEESEEELVKIIRMHSYFPPDADSPEMELVARGLESQFNREGKLEMLESYEKLGGSKTRRVAEEALGLHLSS